MSDPLIPHELVAEKLAIDPGILIRYERLGLIQSVSEAGVVGFRPSEVRRIWSIVSYHRDLGVNLAGVEMLLKIRDQRDELQRLLSDLTRELQRAIEGDAGTDLDA